MVHSSKWILHEIKCSNSDNIYIYLYIYIFILSRNNMYMVESKKSYLLSICNVNIMVYIILLKIFSQVKHLNADFN